MDKNELRIIQHNIRFRKELEFGLIGPKLDCRSFCRDDMGCRALTRTLCIHDVCHFYKKKDGAR